MGQQFNSTTVISLTMDFLLIKDDYILHSIEWIWIIGGEEIKICRQNSSLWKQPGKFSFDSLIVYSTDIWYIHTFNRNLKYKWVINIQVYCHTQLIIQFLLLCVQTVFHLSVAMHSATSTCNYRPVPWYLKHTIHLLRQAFIVTHCTQWTLSLQRVQTLYSRALTMNLIYILYFFFVSTVPADSMDWILPSCSLVTPIAWSFIHKI